MLVGFASQAISALQWLDLGIAVPIGARQVLGVLMLIMTLIALIGVWSHLPSTIRTLHGIGIATVLLSFVSLVINEVRPGSTTTVLRVIYLVGGMVFAVVAWRINADRRLRAIVAALVLVWAGLIAVAWTTAPLRGGVTLAVLDALVEPHLIALLAMWFSRETLEQPVPNAWWRPTAVGFGVAVVFFVVVSAIGATLMASTGSCDGGLCGLFLVFGVIIGALGGLALGIIAGAWTALVAHRRRVTASIQRQAH